MAAVIGAGIVVETFEFVGRKIVIESDVDCDIEIGFEVEPHDFGSR
jgi:hypothetical protein